MMPSDSRQTEVSEFAKRVYDAVSRIPSGRVATYGQIADLTGCPGGARAVGNALHINPFAPVVPCHRVVSADGSLAAHFGGGGSSVQYERLSSEGVTFLEGALKVDLTRCGIVIETHPLEPFLPRNGRVLFLGSFPPPKVRWSMEFFYPNWINDFWRIQGLVHFGDARHFEAPGGEKRFDREKIVRFCSSEGFAFFDTAMKVCRLKGNASDEFLQILQPSDIAGMVSQMPDCHTLVTTGGKSSEELLAILRDLGARPGDVEGRCLAVPGVGECLDVLLPLSGGSSRTLSWFRMPSSSRAYPMSLQTKAAFYSRLSESNPSVVVRQEQVL